MTSEIFTAYIAFTGFESDLEAELAHRNISIEARWERLFLTKAPAAALIWAQNIWPNAQYIEFSSISDAAKKLRAQGKKWALHSTEFHRRASLILAQVHKTKAKPIPFLAEIPTIPWGAFTLLEENLILVSSKTTHPLPGGEVHFQENKSFPPNRAYLKLWELFTVHGIRPHPGSLCLDLGASPGGWTWVLQELGCKVISVDKAKLDTKIAALPNIDFLQQSAFSIEPKKFFPVDWLFSDVICYPKRLYDYIERWLAAGNCKNFVCTIKFQGKTDFEILDKFTAISNSRIIHLFHNKHEVTWILKRG